MGHSTIVKSNVDIYKYPQKEVTHATQLSIGDLHANAMLLMHFLVSNGVVKISEENYAQLKDIYLKAELSEADIQDFNKIIDELEIDEKPIIRFIGDEICDRGQNDYFIFKILDKLTKSEVKTEILLSNHGIEFLIPYENKQDLYAPNIGFYGQSRSMDNMRKLIEKGVITAEQVDAIISESYLPNLKLISYSLHNNDITIYSHAGIGLETIQALAEKFKDDGVVYRDNTAEDLAQTINAINEIFTKHVQDGTAHSLAVNITSPYPDYKKDPVTFLIWNRSYDGLKRDRKYKGYQLYFAHGHDSGELTEGNIINLDNTDFKGAPNNIGSYTVLGSQGGPVVDYRAAVHTVLTNVKSSESADLSLAELDCAKDKSLVKDEYSDMVSPFHSELSKLEAKANLLRSEGHQDAYKKAMEIHTTLDQAYKTLQHDGNRLVFNQVCTDIIAKNRPGLDKHRGWSEFLVNLAIAIPTLGIGLLIKGAINLAQNKSFFFVHKTNTGKIVDEIQKKLDRSV